jgi:hypothetical protein
MNKALSKAQIFWAPTLETARNIDDSDTVLAIEAARHRFNASMRDLETAFDAKASELRAAFVAEIADSMGTGSE